MKIEITQISGLDAMRWACDMTRKPGVKASTMSLANIYRCEHSPMRAITYGVKLVGIPTFVSTHLVRHKFGVEHFVESNREDRGGAGDTQVNRLTPVNHGMILNAQAIVNISLKRLCYAASGRTVAVWRKVRNEINTIDPALADAMVPECVKRGYCPELRQCRPGLKRVLMAYKDTQPMRIRRQQLAEIGVNFNL